MYQNLAICYFLCYFVLDKKIRKKECGPDVLLAR